MPNTLSENGYWGGNVPMIIEVHDEAEDIDYLKRSGGAVMNWNYNELAATLRAEMSSHPPIVVLENEEDDETAD